MILSVSTKNALHHALITKIGSGELIYYAHDGDVVCRTPLEYPCAVVENGVMTFKPVEGIVISNKSPTYALIENNGMILELTIGIDLLINESSLIVGGTIKLDKLIIK